MRKLMAALVCSLLVMAALFGCSSEQPAAPKEECARDAECAPGLHCTPQHSCQQCAFDTQCPDSERCDRGSCISRVVCSTNRDCPSAANPICDAALKECVGCASDGDCDAPQRCLEHACQSARGCASQSDCKAEQVCQQGQCIASCRADADCAGVGLVCDYTSHTCKQCLVNADCPSAYHCAAGSCERDACAAGASRCTQDGHGVELCSPAGDRWLTLFCAASQSCDVGEGKASCSGWSCTPHTLNCSSDARRVEVCAEDGESLQIDHECPANQACTGSECKDVICAPGKAYCQGGAVQQCSDDGTASTMKQACAANSYCDEATAECLQSACIPGTLSCQDNEAVRCNADGSGFETTAKCGKSSTCMNGACRALVCEPDARACDAQGRVTLCNANGTASAVVDTCDAGQHCVQSASGTACIGASCVAGEPSCDGDVLVKCKADGSGFEAESTDCAATNAVCYAGACRSKLCSPNTLSCIQGGVYLCVQNGTTTLLFDSCDANEYCDATSAACKTRICTPNAASCSGNTATTCNADGSGYLAASALDCAASAKVCVAGSCVSPVCTPNAYSCQSGDVYRCNAQGTASTLDTNCADTTQHCAQTGNAAFCASNVCVPSSTSCNGNVATKCLADGSGYEAGIDCGAQVCISGACQQKLCVPNNRTCVSGNSYLCNATGTTLTLAQTCSAVQSCSGGVCIPDVCAAGVQACLGEVLGTCNADGSALSITTTDCNASHQVCSLGGCVATATDSLAGAGSSLSVSSTLTTMNGDFVYVSTARRLKLMQQTLSSPYNYNPLRWVVYQSDAAFGAYQMVFDTLAPIASNATAVNSSGPLDVPLLAGKYYYFATVGGPGVSFSSENSSAQRYISFGHVLGGYTTTFTGAPANAFAISSFNSSFTPVVLTTTLP